MLISKDAAEISAFLARQSAQWERISGRMPGLQLIRSGEKGTSFMLVYSAGDFYEGVIFGQMPHRMTVRSGSPRNPVKRDAKNEGKPPEKRGVDFTDAEIDAVLAAWSAGKSAITLPFVANVWRRDGKPHTS